MTRIKKRRTRLAVLAVTLVIGLALTLGLLEAQTAISTDGVIESTSGGFKFPDGTMQVTAAAPGSVVDTGQQACWDAAGTSISCSATGQDGEFQKGVDWPAPRFTDNGDGTVTDNLTGLIWLKDANCPAAAKLWQESLDWVDDLNTMSIACTDYTATTFTDWRLPNIRELFSLLDFDQAGPALPLGHPFVNVQSTFASSFYNTSTSDRFDRSEAWAIQMFNGNTANGGKTAFANFVWPVRGGL